MSLAGLLLLTTPLAARAADGEAGYAANCASCHGASGAGDTPVGQAMKIPPIGGMSAAHVTHHVNEAANHAAIKGKLSSEELDAISTFVAGLD
jgi:mono/diheme cytochrome c family protein